jgi:hypothetical protein
MKTHASLILLAVSAVATGCGTTSDLPDGSMGLVAGRVQGSPSSSGSSGQGLHAPTPWGEVALSNLTTGQRFAGLEAFDAESLVLSQTTTLGLGRYVGDLVLDQDRMVLRGSGAGQTVIDGNLTLGNRCVVTGLTVTGDVFFVGNNARVRVESVGQFLDYGVNNSH